MPTELTQIKIESNNNVSSYDMSTLKELIKEAKKILRDRNKKAKFFSFRWSLTIAEDRVVLQVIGSYKLNGTQSFDYHNTLL